MFFVGIITNQKNETYIKNELVRIMPLENIIFINDKNISNIKNIKFETIIIDSKINNKNELRKIISNTKYIILNSDIELDVNALNNLNLIVITYGFNNKSTFSVSSIGENSMIICLQRIIFGKNGKKHEPQEYEVKVQENVDKYTIIAISIFNIIYE